MQLADARSAYEALSGKASEIARQLAFAGLGLIWLFRVGGEKSPALNQGLLRAALFISSALLFDFLQYLVGTLTWFLYFRSMEKKGVSPDETFLVPSTLNSPMWALFYLKSAMMLVAYIGYIVPFLIRRFAE